MRYILAVETSCDETCLSVVDCQKNIVSNLIYSQATQHSKYSGVVPEVAARLHLSKIGELTQLAQQKSDFNSLSAIAATGGPGLIGGVITGVTFAKSLSLCFQKPFIAINHLEGHILSARLESDVEFPYLALLISGGHCQFVSVEDVGKYRVLGETLDDSLGETFDKLAKMLELGYPGGPIVERYALSGNRKAFSLPIPLSGRDGCDLSFSGLKTHMRYLIQKLKVVSDSVKNDLCASFEYTVGVFLSGRCKNAIAKFKRLHSVDTSTLVIVGGVASNNYLRNLLKKIAEEEGFAFFTPSPKLCTDNAAMIAWAAQEHFTMGHTTKLDFCARSRWSLSDLHTCYI
ncbi:tRNA (adenosine(37)-N6)-threonylcarbamoyltransferase complex transferase subunit TsaD [Candidatus Sneabacter namystus]|uniref:tRNA N6-adenosine threonylcarbamoyltransferase n=1 Tax=Candidatus Sneabacter namystus TaxID=2601646 RepID=A0A5C0UHI2_9RICK|nr:tRNA (adenosine(37)-N6)-threonylcarbamoyltransferase complex transferase subunit TsaD [Candidatus Sneabacter namystus]QEK39615.1 tRNA (adenosine(37)-N6)-threonylcarbamoyltransferase complex transferase subunit TsaD [Candidatus Sneabacter namystus]